MGRFSGRRLLLALSGSLLMPLGSAHGDLQERHGQLLPTPQEREGSFYPTALPVDVDNDLLRIVPPRSSPAHDARRGAEADGRSFPLAAGRAVYLSGRVLDTGGGAVRAARVEIWQCDAGGVYRHPQASGRPDRNFAGYGVTTADWAGNYHFRTLRPVPCAERTPHVHMRVTAPGHVPLTTRIYDAGQPERNAADSIYRRHSPEARRQLTVEFQPLKTGPSAPMSATFDVVLALD
ncbi:dioxygenase family protein [Lentisalinibacter orientalis]|uniref:dioxygenase family protein n=1 Tax=Lentisalinibacter orientalis TaxID=2992241 RepID=UPI00386E0A06